MESPVLRAQPGMTVVGAAGADVTITLPQVRGGHRWSAILWSYDDTPDTGRLTITGGGFAIDVDIRGTGVGWIPWMEPQAGAPQSAVVITLYAGAAAVVGKLNVVGHRVEGGA